MVEVESKRITLNKLQKLMKPIREGFFHQKPLSRRKTSSPSGLRSFTDSSVRRKRSLMPTRNWSRKRGEGVGGGAGIKNIRLGGKPMNKCMRKMVRKTKVDTGNYRDMKCFVILSYTYLSPQITTNFSGSAPMLMGTVPSSFSSTESGHIMAHLPTI